ITPVPQATVDKPWVKGKYRVTISEDGTKMLLVSMPEHDEATLKPYSCRVFDSNMKLIWEKDFQGNEKHGKMTVIGFAVNNTGAISLLQATYLPKKEQVRARSTVTFMIMTYDDQTGESKTYGINMDGYHMADFRFDVNKSGDVFFMGYYSERVYYDLKLPVPGVKQDRTFKGPFLFKLDHTTQRVTGGIKEFSKDFMKKHKNTSQKDMDNISIRDYHFRDDGGVYMIAEKHSISGDYTNNTYNYQDLFIVSFLPTGKMLYRAYPKRQTSSNDNGRYGSYFSWTIDNKTNVLFTKNKIASQYIVDERIMRTTVPVKEFPYPTSTLMPRFGKQVGEKEIILVAGDEFKFQFAQLTIK
ncbi:MAG: hypothetical protein IIA45_15830, partial [Bacteroidetes bacterium]|nr:hypothetical protein [Bacteroidota bacterium]